MTFLERLREAAPARWMIKLFEKRIVRLALVTVVGVLAVMLLFVAAIAPQRYSLRVGMVPTMDITANKDIVDTVATEDKRTQAAAAITPIYYVDESIMQNVLNDLSKVFAELRAVYQHGQTLIHSQAGKTAFTPEEITYTKGMLKEITMTSLQLERLLTVDQTSLETLFNRLDDTVAYEMEFNRVTINQENTSIQRVLDMIGYVTDPGLLQYVARPILRDTLRANRLVDEDATALKRQEARDAIDEIMVLQGELVVSKGAGRITRRQITLLEAMGILSDGSIDLNIYMGAALTVALTMLVTLLAVAFLPGNTVRDERRLTVFFLVILLSLGLSILTRLINTYLVPVAMAAMLGAALLGMPTGICAGIAVTVLTSALAAGSSEAYSSSMVHVLLIGFSSCTLSALSLKTKPTRVRVLMSGLIASVAGPAALLGVALMTSGNLAALLPTLYYTAAGGMLSAALAIGAQPILEMCFNLPTAARLIELSNPNQPLLRRMLLEAPGTYHHSLIVGNLAEAAADAIGADALLARVAGNYHDVGKLKRPLYFMENQMGVNPHDHTDPYVSADIVTAHITDGMTLARNYRLPEAVRNILFEHHGDTATMFFYHKALQQANGKPVDIARFRYDGRRPTTRESAVVMLADTIEAAVRSMTDPTPKRIEEFIIRLVRGKLEDGQLADCPLTLRDIDAICLSFATVLIGVFHERIEYPEIDHPPRLLEQMEAEAQKKQVQELSGLSGEHKTPPEPQKPDAPEPQKPDAPEPQKPDAPEPQKPDAPEPQKPDTPEPQKPDTPEPQKPDAPEPQKADTPAPQKADTPAPQKPDAPEPAKSKALKTDASVAGGTAEPGRETDKDTQTESKEPK